MQLESSSTCVIQIKCIYITKQQTAEDNPSLFAFTLLNTTSDIACHFIVICYNSTCLLKRRGGIMKKFISKQKNCFWALIGLILIVETLLTIDNKIIQSMGIMLTPFLVIVGYLLIRNDQKRNKNEGV